MKIKNDLISIKIGNKHYDFHNLILNIYLNKFVFNQLNIQEAYNKFNNRKDLIYLVIKFDTPFENIDENSVIRNDEFDICASFNIKTEQEIKENQISTKYIYNINDIVKYRISRRTTKWKYK